MAGHLRAHLTTLSLLLALGGCGGESSKDTGGGAGGALGGNGGSAGSTGGSGGSTGGSGGTGGAIPKANKVDVLLVVDNSISMADKQEMLRLSVDDLVGNLVNPPCVDGAGNVLEQPAGPEADCSSGARRFTPVRDMHLGVVSSSLGAHGGDICSAGAEVNDRARLLTRGGAQLWAGGPFLKWDPDQTGNPPGESDATQLSANVAKVVLGAGENGCGFEATLEAAYRFLVEPMPPAEVKQAGGFNVLEGIDDTLLAQRQAFLRPDSAVLVVILSDENDCSIRDGAYPGDPEVLGQSWLMTAYDPPPRASSACDTDPNSPCCYTCALGAPDGCPQVDAECQKGSFLSNKEDRLNLRCWRQRQRFGVDFLVPLERYVMGFTKTSIVARDGNPRNNPLFAGGRDPRQVAIAGIVGVPWQYLARDPNAATLSLRSSAELSARWPLMVGDPTSYVAPQDPYMQESEAPRSGQSQIIPAAIQPPSAGPGATINGHEWNAHLTETGDLQYACTFPLPAPRECAVATGGCDCKATPDPQLLMNPLCQEPGGSYGTLQYSAKAYPGLRVLGLLHDLGEQGVVGSICPREVLNTGSPDFAYRPVMRAIGERMQLLLE